jgi:hypothetical protein
MMQRERFNEILNDIDRYSVSKLPELKRWHEVVNKWFMDSDAGRALAADIEAAIDEIEALNPPAAPPPIERPIDKNRVMGNAVAISPSPTGWYCSMGTMSLAAFESYMFHLLKPGLRVLRFNGTNGDVIYRFPPGVDLDLALEMGWVK